MRNKAIMADRNEFTNERVRMDAGSVADAHTSLNLDEWSDEAASTNHTFIQIARLDYRGILAKLDVSNGD